MTRASCLTFVISGISVQLISGQSLPSSAKLEFEVATVRQNKSGTPEEPRNPGEGQGASIASGQLTMSNQTLKTLLGFAFNPGNQRFRNDLTVGAPSWVDSDRFDVVAKAPPGLPPRECFFSGYCSPDKRLAAKLLRNGVS